MNISVILPIYNEQSIIKKTIQHVRKNIPKYVQHYEIIAVDDGSNDKTPQILKQLKDKYPEIKVVTHRPNKGYGATIQSGIRKAKYAWIFFMDSDLQFNVNDIATFIPYTKNYDLVVGYRKDRADHKRRIIMSEIYNSIVRILFPVPIRDIDCAFKLMHKETLRELGKLSNSFFVSSEFMIKSTLNGARIKELPVTHLPRTAGKSKVTMSKILKTIMDLGKIYISTLTFFKIGPYASKMYLLDTE